MSDQAEAGANKPKKGKSRGLLIGLMGALALGGGSFFAVYSGMVPLGGDAPADGMEAAVEHGPGGGPVDYAMLEPPSYVVLDPLVIALSPGSRARHLRVSLQLDVVADAQEAVAAVAPRVMDVLNTFLRAVDEREFENPRAMSRLRAQMLRRIQLVAPEGSVRDVLIQEFLLN